MTHRDISQAEKNNSFRPVLRGQTAPFPAFQQWCNQEAYISSSMEFKGITFRAGQYKILSANTAVEIHGAVESMERFFLLCQKLEALPAHIPAMTHWKPCGSHENMWLLPVENAVETMPVYFFRQMHKDAETELAFLQA